MTQAFFLSVAFSLLFLSFSLAPVISLEFGIAAASEATSNFLGIKQLNYNRFSARDAKDKKIVRTKEEKNASDCAEKSACARVVSIFFCRRAVEANVTVLSDGYYRRFRLTDFNTRVYSNGFVAWIRFTGHFNGDARIPRSWWQINSRAFVIFPRRPAGSLFTLHAKK